MTAAQIQILVQQGLIEGNKQQPQLVETHISWVIMCSRYVYKIKKPVQYSFLDFSTIEKRKYYCGREVELNARLASGMYIGVLPVYNYNGLYNIGGSKAGVVTDYAVQMVRMDGSRQMDILLRQHKVTNENMVQLAEKIATFHRSAHVIIPTNVLDIEEKFRDIGNESNWLAENINNDTATVIKHCINVSDAFMERNRSLLTTRCKAGFFRDGHGDLHSRNIFLLPQPVPYDCIEFNDEYRQIDVLNDVAFLCMDLEAFNMPQLATIFMATYNKAFPCMQTPADEKLFVYYKAYRANIRAKVNSLRARSLTGAARKTALADTAKYIALMHGYMQQLTT
jgi:aminoglycoside phosphotransferase family enzyme